MGAECPDVQSACLKLPDTANMPPADMPMALELVNNSTVLSYAGLQNFDVSKIHVNNQQSAWGNQVREGELVKFRVKASNVDVEGATVIIKDAIGTPLYSLITNSQGYTEEVTLASNFYLDRNLNNMLEKVMSKFNSPMHPAAHLLSRHWTRTPAQMVMITMATH